jgi:phage regulator Rha-like protein
MLTPNQRGSQTMSSREIAELTGKEHRHVKRDCEVMFAELELDAQGYAQNWTHPQNGQTYTEYLLTFELVQTLITGYSIKLRHAVIQRLNELEGLVSQPTKPTIQTRAKAAAINSAFKNCMAMAKLIGLDGNQAILSADRATQKLVGESPLELLNAPQLIAPVKQITLTPTQLGKDFNPNRSAQTVNVILEELGLQTKIGGQWVATEKGSPYCEVIDSGKRHNDGSMIKQIKWYQSVLGLIQERESAAW